MIMLFRSLLSLLILHSPHGATIHIDCTATNDCYNDTVTCSSTDDCIINCNGNSSCSFSTITCPQSQSNCTVICNDNLSCNNINIYSINNYDTINIECKSIHCWSNQHNPVVHYGDATSSKMCTVYDTNICEPNTVLIANDNHNDTIITTTKIRDDTVNVYDNNTNNKNHNKYELDNILLLISIGIFSGLIISICCFAIVFCSNCNHKSSSISKLRIITAARISPSLNRLSPALRPVQLANIDFVPNDMFALSEETAPFDGIVVTVEKYANDKNECDEEDLRSNISPIQSNNINFQNLGLVRAKSLSETINDEFVVCGDDEFTVTTPC